MERFSQYKLHRQGCKNPGCEHFHPLCPGMCPECFEILLEQVNEQQNDLFWSFRGY